MDEQAEFEQWKREKADRDRKVGDYWLSQEGRDEAREGFEYADGSSVGPLLAGYEEFLKATELMLANEDCGGDGWWAGWDAIKRAYSKSRPEPNQENDTWDDPEPE